ncbi:hypothetical protein MRB53_001941 [Persea americana]|uniref:Uncharacterized protein n=1 Tax=Persea americana TaxID=3435 RepID=A0ACC2MTS3_PERAE|nr:hypothetical protein MRB53_001941 [Persea americana]
MLSFARILVNLELAKPNPNSLVVELEGHTVVEVEVLYENIPCSSCLSAGHMSAMCPFSSKPSLLKTPSTVKVQPTVRNHPRSGISKVSLKTCMIGPNASNPASTATEVLLNAPLDLLDQLSIDHPASALQFPPHKPNSTMFSTPNTGPHTSCTYLDPTLLDENPVLSIPTDIIYEVLEKFPTLSLDCSNRFSILENRSLADPPFFYSKTKNLIATPSRPVDIHNELLELEPVPMEPISLDYPVSILPDPGCSSPVSILPESGCSPLVPSLSIHKDPPTTDQASITVDLSPFKLKSKRKSKSKGRSSEGPKTRSSSDPPSLTIPNV